MNDRIEQYWSDTMGVSIGTLPEGKTVVVPHARTQKPNSAYIFVRGHSGVVAVEKAYVTRVRERAAGLPVEDILTEAGLHALFARPIRRRIGPAFQGYAEKEDWVPFHLDTVRPLSSADEPRLRQLAANCDPVEWEHSGVKLSKRIMFGCFSGAELVAVAHYDIWAEYGASIGIITHPGYRGRGYGKAAVSAAMAQAFEQGHLVIYQTLANNFPSVALAKQLGCQEYAQTMRIYFDADKDGASLPENA